MRAESCPHAGRHFESGEAGSLRTPFRVNMERKDARRTKAPKTIEVALPLDDINVASAREKSISAWASEHLAPVVGAAAVGGGAGSVVCADGE
jgi:hypothetical protein